MAKNKKKKQEDEEKESWFSHLTDETKHSVLAIIFFAIAVFLVLSAWGQSGIVGRVTFNTLDMLLGIGYFILPLLLLMLGVSFFKSERPEFSITKTIGAFVFFLSGLGIMALLFGENSGGILGYFIAAPLNALFEMYTTLIFLVALLAISILLIFNTRLSFARPSFTWFKQKDAEEEDVAVSGVGADDEEEWDEEEEYEDEPEEDAEEYEEEEPEEEPGKEKRSWFGGKKKDAMDEVMGTPSLPQIDYAPPPFSLLSSDKGKPGVGDVKANANIIKRTLANFGITVEMDEITVGPSVTRYALKPAEGVKLARIVGLQNDLGLALAAHPIRIEAPIPGKSLVGIEVPNTARSTVGLATLIKAPEFQEAEKPLLFALGKNISGKSFYADLAKIPHMLIAGATGSGKTCSKDTYVFSEKGMMTFEELCPLPLNSEVDYSIEVATRDGIERTSKNYNNGICDFYKITTEEGLSIEVTDEHPLWTIQNSVMGWQSGGSIQTGEYVAISRGAKLFGENGAIQFTPESNKTNKAHEISLPQKMTEKLGLFMGLLAADGGLSIKNRIVFTQANKEVLNTYCSLLKELFAIEAPTVEKSGSSNKAKNVIVNSKNLKGFLAYLGMPESTAQTKEIPLSVRQSDADTVRAFVKGLMRCDGHVSAEKGIEITLANKTLLTQLQILLLNFGIVSSVHAKPIKAYEQNDYWRLTIHGAEFVRYAEEIGFLTEEEKRKADTFAARRRNANRNVIPTLSPVLKRLARTYRSAFAKITEHGWQYKEGVSVPKYAFGNLRSYNSGARNPSYNALEQILSFYAPIADTDEYKTLSRINEHNFYWAKVADIEKTRGEGYDFEVPGSNSFVGNGFVNHNSVTIHAIITSLLYRNSPENMRLLMVDPKRVELTLYNKTPHLLTPVITDPKKAILALKWAAKEMDRRYDILEAESVRDISSYHANVVNPAYEDAENMSEEELANLPERMPYIVIIIDELADIMTSYPRELESSIVRIAQMSRAVGIHLILSTQRPSVNVITGLIKANVPGRLALQVASQIDSRTILDAGGAEKLLGAGDMLYLSGEMAQPQRLQSAHVTENEVKKVVKYLSGQYKDEELEEISFTNDRGEQSSLSDVMDHEGVDDDDEDDLYEEARDIVVHAKKASTSYLQRKLKVGYARAARLMDMLEERGIVGPAEGSKPREVLVGDDGYGGSDSDDYSSGYNKSEQAEEEEAR